MKPHEWYQIVAETIRQNPDWLGITYNAMTDGIQTRLNEEISFRSNAEAALSITFDVAKDNIPKQHLDMVKQTIKNSKLLAGTPYAEKL